MIVADKVEKKPGFQWPKQVKRGFAVVKVYRHERADGYQRFMVENYVAGKRRLKSFSDETKAMALAKQQNLGGPVVATLANCLGPPGIPAG